MQTDGLVPDIEVSIRLGMHVLFVADTRQQAMQLLDKVALYAESVGRPLERNERMQRLDGEGCATFLSKGQDRRGMRCDYLIVGEGVDMERNSWIAPYAATALAVNRL